MEPAVEALFSRYPKGSAPSRVQSARRVPISVPGGEITAYAMRASSQRRGRPVVFVPGWGGVVGGFADVIDSVDPSVDLYYVETREKRSSRLERGTSFRMRRIAADIGLAVARLGLDDGDYVLLGSSFGGAVVLEAVADGFVRPAVTVLYDPMPRLWIPRWIIRVAGPLVTPGVLSLVRPALKRLILAGMQEPTQRRRTERFIDEAELWKWRAAARRMNEWDLFDVAPAVWLPVDVVNGSTDRFHEGSVYPAVAEAIPSGRLVKAAVDEAEREHFIGAVASAYALHENGDLPEMLRPLLRLGSAQPR